MSSNAIATAAALEPDPQQDRGWREESWRQPRDFLVALQQWLADRTGRGFKSVPGASAALYHDCVERHLGGNDVALRWYDHRKLDDDGWDSLSFDALHARCTLRAASWTDQGVEPGAVVCVVWPLGVEAVVSMLAGLRLGACISFLEPHGAEYLARRLGELAPQHIATEDFYRPLLGEMAELVLATDGIDPGSGSHSHTYAPDEPCARLFSPLRSPPEAPVPLTAGDAHLRAVCDGAVTYVLRPGDALAAPGFHVEQHQPALLLATLSAGATFVHVPTDDALEDPSRLDAHPLRAVGLSSDMVQALLSGAGGTRHRWDHVFKNPEEPTDWEAWRELVESHRLDDTIMSNVIGEAASGGALLTSTRRTGKQHLTYLMNVVPAPGRPWTLLDFSRSGQDAVGDVGVFAPMAGEPGAEAPVEPQYIALGRRHGGEYLYGGTLEPRRDGRIYPVDEVLAALADCPFLDGASVVALPAGGSTLAQRFVLLGFVGDETDEAFEALRSPREAELLRMLGHRMGEDVLPDRVELYPLHARKKDDAIDHDWCRGQYLTGTLHRKVTIPAFRRMAALRQTTR